MIRANLLAFYVCTASNVSTRLRSLDDASDPGERVRKGTRAMAGAGRGAILVLKTGLRLSRARRGLFKSRPRTVNRTAARVQERGDGPAFVWRLASTIVSCASLPVKRQAVFHKEVSQGFVPCRKVLVRNNRTPNEWQLSWMSRR